MRDPSAYLEEGRSDPLAPDQLEEHPYDFVSLPAALARGAAVGHDKSSTGRLSGHLLLVYRNDTPLHIGSGVFETAEDCGLQGGTMPVRGIVRRLGRPVLPGSSWKGAVRARFEAITRSPLGVAAHGGREDVAKLPQPLIPPDARDKVDVRLPQLPAASRINRGRKGDHEIRNELAELGPAEALFGAMGYRGRLHPGDGEIAGDVATVPLAVPPLESPAVHRLAKPGAASVVGNHIEITDVEGRKFYYDGPLLDHRILQGGANRRIYEWIDHVPAGSTIRLKVVVESVTEAEIGALLVSAGMGSDAGILRFGGYKPAGLGKVTLAKAEGTLHRLFGTTAWRRPPGQPLDATSAVAAAHASGLIDAGALAELNAITTRLRS